MIYFALRNLKVFYKDKSSVFFSMLAVIIIIVLYFAFLGDAWSAEYQGVDNMRGIMDNWISAGLLAVGQPHFHYGRYWSNGGGQGAQNGQGFLCLSA